MPKFPWCSRRSALVVTVLTVALGATVPPSRAATGSLELIVEQEFDQLIKSLAGSLPSDQRLLASRRYVDDGDGGYTVYAIQDHASPLTLKTERYRLRIGRNASGKWDVVARTLEDTSERLFRETAEAQQFFTFESVSLEREGLTIQGGKGAAVVYEFQGSPSRVLFAADELQYDYRPPQGPGALPVLYGSMRNTFENDFEFAPRVVELHCDASSCAEMMLAFEGRAESGETIPNEALEQHYTHRTRELLAERRDDPFFGFRLPNRDDKRWYRVSVYRDDEHMLSLRYDNRSGHEVRFTAEGYGSLYGYPSEDSRATVSPEEIERRDDADSELYELAGLTGTVELGLLEPELLRADLTFRIRTKRAVDALPFSLRPLVLRGQAERNATLYVNGIEDADGRPLSWTRVGLASGVLLLPETLPAGTETVIRMRFQTSGSLVKYNSSYSYVDRSGWLPFVHVNDEIGEFDLTVKVPSRYTALGVGTQVGEAVRQGDASVTRWTAHHPVRFPTVIFGDYRSDRPKTKATKLDGSEIPVEVFVDKTAMIDWGIRPGQLRTPGEIAINALNVFREVFGTDYPYGKLDLVNDPFDTTGAQAPASIVYLGSAVFRSEATLSDAGLSDSMSLAEEVIAHEVAHQWWGASVSNRNQQNYWFVESLAEYSAALFLEILESEGYQKPEKGRKAYLAHVKRWKDDILISGLLGSVQDAPSMWSNGGRIAAIYDRGPYAFHILRETFGDAKFFPFLKTLAQEFAGQQIVTRDIQRIAEQAFGGVGPDGNPYTVDLEWFFDQWIRGVGLPEYRFEHAYRAAEGGGYIVEGTIEQTVYAGRHDIPLRGTYFRGVVPVTVRGKDRQEYNARVVVEGAETPFAFKVPSEPVEVTLNRDGEMLVRKIIEPNP